MKDKITKKTTLTKTVTTREKPDEVDRRKFLADAARLLAGTVGAFWLMSMAKIDSVLGWDESLAQSSAVQKSIRRKAERTLVKTMKKRTLVKKTLISVKELEDKACSCACSCGCHCTCDDGCGCNCHCDCVCEKETFANAQTQTRDKTFAPASETVLQKVSEVAVASTTDGTHTTVSDTTAVANFRVDRKKEAPGLSGAALGITAAALGAAGAWRILKHKAAEKFKGE